MAKILEMDKPKDSKVKETEEIDPFPSHVIQELQALWEITNKRFKGPRMMK